MPKEAANDFGSGILNSDQLDIVALGMLVRNKYALSSAQSEKDDDAFGSNLAGRHQVSKVFGAKERLN